MANVEDSRSSTCVNGEVAARLQSVFMHIYFIQDCCHEKANIRQLDKEKPTITCKTITTESSVAFTNIRSFCVVTCSIAMTCRFCGAFVDICGW